MEQQANRNGGTTRPPLKYCGGCRNDKVTFELPDDTTKTVNAGKKVDLSAVQPGDNVTVQLREGLAITVAKP